MSTKLGMGQAFQYAKTYNVYQISADGQKTLVTSTTALTYTITNVPAGTYTYAVSSMHSLYGESVPSTPVQLDVVFPVMAAPGNLTFSIANGNDVTLRWSSAANASNYKVYQMVDGQKVLKSTIAGTTVTYTNMAAGDYTFVVHSVSSRFGESQEGSSISLTVSGVSMAAPGSFAYKLQNVNDIVLTWGSVPYANNYKVYQIIEGQKVLKSTVVGTTVTYSNMPAGDYTYVVHSFSSKFGESAEGSQVAFTIGFPTMQAPGNLTHTLQNFNDITLSWGSVANANSYKVYQIVNGQKILKSTVTAAAISYTNAAAGDYTFIIHSYSDRFGESSEGTEITFTVVYPVMQAPGNFTYAIQNGNDMVLSWGSVANANSYKVYQIVNGQKVLKSTVNSTTATYTNMPAGDYRYEVYSVSTRFGESAEGSQVNIALVHPVMQPPANLVQTIKNATDFTLTWDACTYATSYKVYQLVNGQRVLKNTLTGTTAVFTNMPTGDYIYQIHSYSSRFGESFEGSQVTVPLKGKVMQAPTNLTCSIANGNDLTLRWTAAPDATNYRVYQVIDGQRVLKSTIAGTTVTYANMPGADYTYQVYSYSALFGESQTGAEIMYSLKLPVMAAPGNAAYNIQNGNDVVLSWSTVAYATGYKVYELVGGQKVLKSSPTSLTATLANVTAGEHTYIIHSNSDRFGISPEGSEVAINLVFPVMQAPGNFTHSIANKNDIVLKWNAAAYAASYKVYQIIDGQKVLKSTIPGTTVTYTNMPEGEYKYEVHSVSTRFGESADGSQISFTLVHPDVFAPANLTYSITNGNDITMRWDAAANATSYRVYRIVDGQKVLKTTVTSSSLTYTNMPEGEYVYEIYSVSTRFGESLEGSRVSFTLVFPVMQAPGSPAYSITNGNDIILRWSTVPYASSYKVYQVTDGQKVLKGTVSGATVTYANMPQGDYTYEVHSISSRFGESVPGSEISFTLVHPVMQAPGTLTHNIANGNDITLNWGTAAYASSYKVYQVVNGQKILKSTIAGTSITYTNMPEGEYKYEVHSVSTRFGESPEGRPVNLELVWPVVQPPLPTRTIFNINNITLTWKAVNWASEYRVYEVKGDTRQLLYKGTALSFNIYNISEGTHTYEMTTYNTRFGESEPSQRLTDTIIYPDMTAPIASLKLLDATTARVSWTFTTYANGYNVYEMVDGVPVLLIKNLNNLSYTISNLTYKDHEYYVTAYSNSFGESEPSNTVIAKLIVDTEAPVTTANVPAEWTNQSVNVALSATDNETGVAHTYFSVNNGTFTEGTGFTVAEEGINKVSFYSADKVGNTEETKTAEVKIDRTAPSTVVNIPSGWSKGDVTVSLTAQDALSGTAKTFYSINGSEYAEGQTLTVSKEGVNKISFYSVDAVGNVEPIKTSEVKIDKTAPAITMNLNGEYKLGSTVKLVYTVQDNLSGIASEKMTVVSPGETTGKVLANGSELQLARPGTYNITVTATDAAGLSTTIKRQLLVCIQATIEVTPKVIKGNNGVFTVRVSLPMGYSTEGLDLKTATLNGVKALSDNNGYFNQAKNGQFKFERSDFTWNPPEMLVEFRGYVNGHLVVGQTIVKVQK